ncbi:MAG: sulfatase-like hydrolase/transferase, partial [Betaproteobacteria bacterium]|nr:sulfatase-like hydrolase/transferase [Betaproteobacteria bacterium]
MWAIRLARRFCTEAVLWYCVPLVFLAVYVNRYPVSAGSIWPHLHLLAVIYAGVALVRAALFRLIPWPEGSRLASALVVAGSLAAMLLYYGLVIIGLESWGRVISWDLIATYAPQLSELVEAIDLSAPLVLVSLGLCFLGLLWVVWAYLGHFDWIPLVMRNLSGPLFAMLVICGGAALAIEIHRFALAPWTHESEPLSLTFFPEQSTQEYQSHGIDSLRARMLMRDDDAARSSYRPNPAADRKNLILIAIDGLRPDHMGIYGYPRDTTPNLSRLARSGALRSAGAVYATCGESLCGLVSLASSKYMQQFSARPFTLQEVLQRHGYRIHMILGGDHKNFYGLSQFYGNVDSYYDGSSARGGYMNDDRLVLDRMAAFPAWDGVPVMIQFHLMSVHALGKRHNAAMKYLPAANYMVPGSRATDSIDESRRGGKAINYYDNG